MGFFSSRRSERMLMLSAGSTARSISNKTRTFTSDLPLESAGVEIVAHERRQIGADVDEQRRLVAWCSQPELRGATDQLHDEAIDRVLGLAGPVHDGSGDSTTIAPHEARGSLVAGRELAEDAAEVVVVEVGVVRRPQLSLP